MALIGMLDQFVANAKAGKPGVLPPGGIGKKGVSYPSSAMYTPDYQSILNSDPAFQALKQSLSAQGIQDAAQRSAATNQALIQFGALPNLTSAAAQMGLSPAALKMLQGDINPNTASLAAANQFSTEANLKHDEDKAMMALRNNLAARGGLSSGEDAYQSGEQERSYEQAQQSALTQLLSAITGYQQSYTTSQQNEQQQLAQALQQTEQQDSGLPQYQGFQLNYNARSGKYVGPSGETFTPTRHGSSWVLKDDGTGLSYTLNADGTLTLNS